MLLGWCTGMLPKCSYHKCYVGSCPNHGVHGAPNNMFVLVELAGVWSLSVTPAPVSPPVIGTDIGKSSTNPNSATTLFTNVDCDTLIKSGFCPTCSPWTNLAGTRSLILNLVAIWFLNCACLVYGLQWWNHPHAGLPRITLPNLPNHVYTQWSASDHLKLISIMWLWAASFQILPAC